MYARAYLFWFAVTVASLGVLATSLSILVDPYRMFGTRPIVGWTAIKPRAYQQTGIAKTYQLERIRPATVLLGNSRVEIGLNPESPNWPTSARPVFNAAEAGRDLFSAERMLQEAIAIRPPLIVVVGLDFPDFLEKATSPGSSLLEPGPDERRLLMGHDGSPNPARRWQIWRDRLAATLTLNALLDDAATILGQDPVYSVDMRPNGFNPLHDYRLFVRRSGHYELFAQKNVIYEAQFRRYPVPDFSAPELIANFRSLTRLIQTAARAHSRLILFTPPYHADYLEILRRVGLWPAFESWKRALVRVVETEQRSDPSIMITLLDFAGYDEITTERVPPPGDTTYRMRWYWEAGHYKSELGDRMLLSMLGEDRSFGRVLTSTTIDADLAHIRESRDRFFPPSAQFEKGTMSQPGRGPYNATLGREDSSASPGELTNNSADH